ncbi:hypothetical protein GXW82_29160 [Streptacidiphilus sp. 4-A2]|nr:hypothetical protein [Streptacidiphilus sp. 4-A2]
MAGTTAAARSELTGQQRRAPRAMLGLLAVVLVVVVGLLAVGRAVRMQREADGSYTRPTAANAAGDVTLLLLVLALACGAFTGFSCAARAFVLHLAGPSGPDRGGWTTLVGAGVRAARVVLALLGVSLVVTAALALLT